MASFFDRLRMNIQNFFKSIFGGTAINTVTGTVEKAINTTVHTVTGAVQNLVSTTINTATGTVHMVVNTTVNTVTGTAQKLLNTVGNVINSADDIIASSVNWLKGIQKYWPIYLAIIAIIMVCIVVLYYSVCYYLNRKKANLLSSTFVDLAKVINNKSDILQQKKPLP
ncbi:unnamed protein product [Rotaria sordida]|uniref:Uncharacterized protein n=1 Tax=Rotaria sordida TaxID=392033 RepID=A0A819U3U2_9BILA|nr:unnamed protein product [Rotaria sordida]CAF1261536.1 unnamed protein product [Rotaria sordida]CAF1541646.1 unnamed protein product [Rotaria sordida]CAF4088358.1 unnamed protein product [Rotaria sordida]